jgi:23S rRNA pseudouridine955/2504/2580 synthase
MNSLHLETGPDDEGRRLDRVLRKACAELPISAIHRLLRKGRVSVDGKRTGMASRVRSGQSIEILGVDMPEAALCRKNGGKGRLATGSGVSIGNGIDVLYEGHGILAVGKPAGITAQEELGALVTAYLAGKTASSLSFTPGPLHRLDKGTSGIIVFGSSIEGARRFSALMRSGLLRKTYIALLEGSLRGERYWLDMLEYSDAAQKSRVSSHSGGLPSSTAVRRAETQVFPLELRGAFTLAAMEIATGRRHQIRAQSAAHGFPLYGDRKYGGKNQPPFFLHACRLVFPEDSPFPRSISAPVPATFRQKLFELRFSPVDSIQAFLLDNRQFGQPL